MSIRHGKAFIAAALAAMFPAVGGVGVPTLHAPGVQQTQQMAKAKPETTTIQSVRLGRKMGPLGLPIYAETGGRPPWIDKHGKLLRQVR